MPVSTEARDHAGAAGGRVRRWPPLGHGQGLLLLAAFGIMIGSFLPWVDTVGGRFWGMQGGGVWTFYAGSLALAGGLIPRRRLARINGVVAAAVAIGLPAWQLLHLSNVCDWRVCMPATGLVVVAACGAIAGRATYLLGRTST